MSVILRYGRPPNPRLTSFEVDRTGLRSAVVRTPYIERPEDPLAVDFGPVPRMPRMGLVHAGLRAKSGGPGFEVEWTYEGGAGSDDEPSSDDGAGGNGGAGSDNNVPRALGNEPLREFIPANVERPVLANENWLEIQRLFGGDEYGDFPPEIPSGGSSNLGGATGGTSAQPNPFHGIKTYRSAYGVFQITTLANAARASVLKGVNRIVQTPPGLSKIGLVTPKGHNWLKLAPHVSVRGTVIQFVEQYELSGPGGFNPYLYKGKGDLG